MAEQAPSKLAKWCRNYWVAGLVFLMVGMHAVIIAYVRHQVARLKNVQTTAVEIGPFRFRSIADKDHVHFFQLHAVVDPSRRSLSEERIEQLRPEILEGIQQMLTQAEADWLGDPGQKELRARMLQIVLKHVKDPIIQRLVITDWMTAPADAVVIHIGQQTDADSSAAPLLQ